MYNNMLSDDFDFIDIQDLLSPPQVQPTSPTPPPPPPDPQPQHHVSNESGSKKRVGASHSGSNKRAGLWGNEETRALIHLRKDIDLHFNTKKSNSHLWDYISRKMKEMGYDRSPTMCTDKWKNLLKDFKKASKEKNENVRAKKSHYINEIEEILSLRTKILPSSSSSSAVAIAKVDSFMHLADKGIDDASLSFGSVDANGRSTLNLGSSLDHEEHTLSALAAAEAVVGSGASPLSLTETPGTGEESNMYGGNVITVKMGDLARKVGIDSTPDGIKEAIKSAFGLRSRAGFWLEDEYDVIRPFDRDMPSGLYTLRVDAGVTVNVCMYEESDHLPAPMEAKTFYNDEDFLEFLSRHGWTSLRECNGCRTVHYISELVPGAIYRRGP